ncbi:MAG: serine/threonine-protein kinase [Cyanobacteria bacterium P01_D01_bin.1]
MSYCINPWCPDRQNSESDQHCQSCGTPLLIQGRYRLIQPLRKLDEWEPSEIFEVSDRGSALEPKNKDANTSSSASSKVLKVLKKPVLFPLFKREVETLQQINHPGIPKVDQDGFFSVTIKQRELHCLVMEKIQGTNLDTWLQKHGAIDQNTAVDWIAQLAEILALIHEMGLFHRDVKLTNIMLRPTGQLALIDFGTVRLMTNTYLAKVAGQRDITSVVSPGYTPLEQMNGKAVPQSDFYALGRCLIHLLTGKHPIDLPEDDETGQLDWRDRTAQPIDNWLIQLLNALTAPFPGQRPIDAKSILERLENKQSLPVARSTATTANEKQLFWVLLASNIVLLLALIGMVSLRWSEQQQLERPPQSTSSTVGS